MFYLLILIFLSIDKGVTQSISVGSRRLRYETIITKSPTDIRKKRSEPVCVNVGDSCDDGMYCNGEEVCDESLICVSKNPPCTRCDQICDEEYGICVEEAADCRNINSFTYASWNRDSCECEYISKPLSSMMSEISLHFRL